METLGVMIKAMEQYTPPIEDLIPIASHFHGHLGPFLVLGLKAGLTAIKHLGKDPFHMKVIVTTEGAPPTSCFIDGIQLSTGCTLGKMNIEAKRGVDLSALFTLNGKALKIKVKDEVLEKVRKISFQAGEKVALRIAGEREDNLFEIEWTDRS